MRVSRYNIDVARASSALNTRSSLSIRAKNPPVSWQNTRIPKSILYKTKDIFVDQQITNAADDIRKDSLCRAEVIDFSNSLLMHEEKTKEITTVKV